MKCEVKGCNEQAVSAGLCSACYQGIRYWMNKGTPGAINKRRKQLARLESRMDLIQGVTTVRRRRAG